MSDSQIEIVVLDMAGTTVQDDDLVREAFDAAYPATGRPNTAQSRAEADRYVRETMGQSKISVFRHLTDRDEGRAAAANRAFEAAYGKFIGDGLMAPIPGAEQAIGLLRETGIKVALITGFSPETRDALLDALGWRDIADLVLAPAEVGRGRPFPDLVLTALLRLGGSAVSRIAVAGDTVSDIATGLAAGAGLVAGVLTGGQDAEGFWSAGATHVLESVADLPAVLGISTPATADR